MAGSGEIKQRPVHKLAGSNNAQKAIFHDPDQLPHNMPEPQLTERQRYILTKTKSEIFNPKIQNRATNHGTERLAKKVCVQDQKIKPHLDERKEYREYPVKPSKKLEIAPENNIEHDSQGITTGKRFCTNYGGKNVVITNQKMIKALERVREMHMTSTPAGTKVGDRTTSPTR